MNTQQRKGVTLIEVLVAVIVIGILVTIAIPSYITSAERGKVSHAMNNVKALQSAQHNWYIENTAYTSAVGNLEKAIGADFTSLNIGGTSTNGDWQYAVADGGQTFTIKATRAVGDYAGNSIQVNEKGAWTISAGYNTLLGM